MVVYIAGKIDGEPNYKEIFAKAEQFLKSRGHIVLNPAILPEGMPYERYMPICMAMLDQADAVYLLNNWTDSRGAMIEMSYAGYQGKLGKYL